MLRPACLALSLALATLVPAGAPAHAALPADLDSDGFANAADDCRFVANSGQEDLGGLGSASAPDGIGDACQCGNVSGSGRIDADDIAALRAMLANPLGSALPVDAAERCAVYGDLAACDVLQLSVLRRALAALPPVTGGLAAQHCPAAISERIHVATTGSAGGDGTPASPMRRITDALERARADRSGGELPAAGGIRILVAPGSYSGSFGAAAPPTEVLPLVLNVPRLSLIGSTELTRDVAGLPTGVQSPTETKLATDTGMILSGQYLAILGATTDGGTASGGSLERFVLDGGSLAQFHSAGVFVDRVTGFAIRDNLIERTGYGLMTRLASGTIQGNLLQGNGDSGAFVTGGSLLQPASVSFVGNRVQGNGHGLMAKGIGGVSAPAAMGASALALLPIQTLFDRDLAADLLNLPDHLDVSVVGNEFAQNSRLGVRLAATTSEGATASCTVQIEYRTNGASQPLTASVAADVRGNAFLSNTNWGVGIEPAFPCRSDPRRYEFDVSARLLGNAYASNGRGRALFTFTRWSVSAGSEAPGLYKYVEASTYDVVDPLGEVEGFHFDHPAQDPVTAALLGNTLRYNGAAAPNGKSVGP